MRVTNGKRVRKYVYDVRLGDNKAAALYRGDRKIWPTLSDTVYSCVLDVTAHEGGELWPYWLHALDAVGKLGASAECHMKLTAGGREYMLGSTFGNWYLAEYDGRATVVFGDNGPLADRLRVGDEVVVELRVPGRRVVIFNRAITGGSLEVDVHVPLLPGSVVGFSQSCAGKRNWSFGRLAVSGAPSGEELLAFRVDKQSRTWVTYSRVVQQVPAADSGWKAVFSLSGSGYLRDGFVSYPAFARRVVFKVSAVTRHG